MLAGCGLWTRRAFGGLAIADYGLFGMLDARCGMDCGVDGDLEIDVLSPRARYLHRAR